MPTNVDVVTAVHHPLRRRLVELLHLDGPATASVLAAATDQLVGNISHHLKVLAKAGLVEEAPELARDRRERWWRVVKQSVSWTIADVLGDPVAEPLLAAAEQQNLTHQVGKVQEWAARRDAYDPAFLRAAFVNDYWIEATPDELAELGAAISVLFAAYGTDRTDRPDPPDGQVRERCFVFAHGMPSRP